jgi:hypothetical protein
MLAAQAEPLCAEVAVTNAASVALYAAALDDRRNVSRLGYEPSMSEIGRYCCKSIFGVTNEKSQGRRCVLRAAT